MNKLESFLFQALVQWRMAGQEPERWSQDGASRDPGSTNSFTLSKPLVGPTFTLSHFHYQVGKNFTLLYFHTFTPRFAQISHFHISYITGSSNFHIFTRRLVPGTRWRPLVSCAQVPRQIQVFVSFEIIFLMTMKTMMVLVKFDSLSCVLKWQNYPQGWAHIWLLHIHVYLLNAHHCSAQFVFVHV